MTVFEFTDYKAFVTSSIAQMPKKGRGQFRKMALFLSVNPVIVSQIFNGERHLNHEQAYDLGGFFGFSENEREYFMLLVQRARAGTHSLQKHLNEKIREAQVAAQDLKKRLKVDKEITEEAKALFYSNWYYSGFRMASSIEGMKKPEDFATYFDMPLKRTREVLEFLISHGLCEIKNGEYHMGAKRTHVGAESPLVSRHHQNWRTKAYQHMERLTPEEMFFTSPMAIAEEDIPQVRQELVKAIDKIMKIIEKTKGGRLACLNMDWFRF